MRIYDGVEIVITEQERVDKDYTYVHTTSYGSLWLLKIHDIEIREVEFSPPTSKSCNRNSHKTPHYVTKFPTTPHYVTNFPTLERNMRHHQVQGSVPFKHSVTA